MSKPGLAIDEIVHVLEAAGTDLAIIGGQAVALWAEHFAGELRLVEPATSKDIDLWGDRKGLLELAKRLNTQAHLPDSRVMTRLSGIIELRDREPVIRIDVLHHVPGLDGLSWEKSTVIIEARAGALRVLDPITLIRSKFYNLKHFDQSDRNDLGQLKLCIRMAKIFIGRALSVHVKAGLVYIERLIEIACLGDNQTLIQKHQLKLLEAIPIAEMQSMADSLSTRDPDSARLRNFLSIRWEQLRANGFVN